MDRMKQLLLVFFSTVCLLSYGCGGKKHEAGAPVNFMSMLPRLTNRADVAMSPPAGARMRMVSSYDRTGGNNDWLQGLVPDENGLVTIAKINGPGCVVRFWMTGGRYQDLRFYFDGENEPRIEMPRRNGLFGGDLPFAYPLTGIISSGAYSYVPLPFQKSLVIKGKWPDISPDNRPYLHVNYFEYPDGTQVESFPHELNQSQLDAVAAINREWSLSCTTIYDPDVAAGPDFTNMQSGVPEDRQLTAEERKLMAALNRAAPITLLQGESHLWLDENGEAMIDSFAITIDFDAQDNAVARKNALRELALHFYWDGLDAPSVAVPLGDFFGNALNWRAWRSMFASQLDGVFFSQWPMPYKNGVRAVLRNDGAVPLQIRTVYHIAGRPNNARYFHAAWNHAVGDGQPYPILYTEGSGHYSGCYLVSLSANEDWNILEGDESFLIDNESWPSLHGTGLEDYFNGAWYYSGLCDMPIHGLLEKAAMRTTQYRWHPNDLVPFSERLSMQIEFGHGNAAHGYMSSVAFWYQDEPQPRPELAVDLRHKPPDQLDNAVIMSELIELERIGHWREAGERCELFAENVDDQNISDLMQLRRAAYAFLAGESNAVTKLIQNSSFVHTEVQRQADMLAALEVNSDAGIMGVQCRGVFKVYLNGLFIGEGNSPNDMLAWPVVLPDGEHEITVEVVPDHRSPLMSFTLRWDNVFLRTDNDWEFSTQKPVDWPETADDSVKWIKSEKANSMLPRMDCWLLNINALVHMQSARQLHRAAEIWNDSPREKVYFRYRFTKE